MKVQYEFEQRVPPVPKNNINSQLLILDSVVDIDSLASEFDQSTHTTVVSFCDDPEWLDRVVDRIRQVCEVVEVVNGAEQLDLHAPVAKRAYLDHVATVSDGNRPCQSFKEVLSRAGQRIAPIPCNGVLGAAGSTLVAL